LILPCKILFLVLLFNIFKERFVCFVKQPFAKK